MRNEPVNRGAELPAALAAFLRGAERRAFVFLWLQGGDAAAAERALAAAIRAFPGPAERMPMAEWPTRFWKLLLALPLEAGAGDWPPALAFLGPMRPSVRRALLLRQVAGLDEATAAAVLGTQMADYQQALAEACPRDASGGPDAAGWRQQAEAIAQAGRELDPAQQQRLLQLRESALAGRAMPAPPRPVEPAEDRRPARGPVRSGRRRRGGWIAAAVAAVVLASGAAWYAWSPTSPAPSANGDNGVAPVDDLRVHDNEPVVVEPLPEADPPALPPDWPAALAEPVQDPVVAGLPLLSWYAAGAPASHIEREGDASATPIDGDSGEPADANVTAAAAEAWQQLDAFEQARVRAAALALQELDPPARAALRTRFASLDAMERNGWMLGPALGADYAALQPLLGFVGEGEREPLLAALRAMTPEQRRQLGDLSRRTPPAEREALRRELLATPPPQRGAWLEERGRR
ncbi:hypothetical protein MNQ95_08005 [Pseudoxanthomonas daejeonensis]|uniref:hypothetical protein n=1 Tax=Pseudoxanthomonas daejeonensis TaxID=266062 RepID=UPI001F548124|nr:hypothetical protein [Pseudoxanthomonas daejeonensis]UNK56127.1 hypothetical protein MNQ95_08005 [Pseudoxanthomonas daejeonensis]